MGELGRYPLMLEVLLNMLKLSYYVRLLNSDDILLKEVFFVSEQLANENKGSWTSCVKAIFKRKLIRHKVIKLLQEKYILKWQEELFRDNSNSDHGNKLRTYRLFKSNFCFEKYLEWGDYRKRKIMTRFRLSAHDLEIDQRLSRACIVHLVIKKNNWSYVKTMSCSGSHLGITINIKNTKFVKDLPMIDAQFRFNQCNSFREEYISVFSPYGSVLIL